MVRYTHDHGSCCAHPGSEDFQSEQHVQVHCDNRVFSPIRQVRNIKVRNLRPELSPCTTGHCCSSTVKVVKYYLKSVYTAVRRKLKELNTIIGDALHGSPT